MSGSASSAIAAVGGVIRRHRGCEHRGGNITPPCAPLLYLAGAAGRASLLEMLGPALKFLLVGYVPVILLVTYVPDPVLFLPRVLLGTG